jgi:hypothetical protein
MIKIPKAHFANAAYLRGKLRDCVLWLEALQAHLASDGAPAPMRQELECLVAEIKRESHFCAREHRYGK